MMAFKGKSKGKGGGGGKSSGGGKGGNRKGQRDFAAPREKRTTRPGDPDHGVSDINTLNTACLRILKRSMAKGEIKYDTQEVQGGFQSSVTLPELSSNFCSPTF